MAEQARRVEVVRDFYTLCLQDAEVASVGFLAPEDWRDPEVLNGLQCGKLYYDAGFTPPFPCPCDERCDEFAVLICPTVVVDRTISLCAREFCAYLDAWLWRIWKHVEQWEVLLGLSSEEVESRLDRLMYDSALDGMAVINRVDLEHCDKEVRWQ